MTISGPVTNSLLDAVVLSLRTRAVLWKIQRLLRCRSTDGETYQQARVELTLTGYPQLELEPGGADYLHCCCQTLLLHGFMAIVMVTRPALDISVLGSVMSLLLSLQTVA